MKLFRSVVAFTSVFALFVSAVPPVQASGFSGGSYGNNTRNESPRGFKRSISRARDKLKAECIHKKDANERRACMKEYRDTIRKEATPVTGNYVDHNVQQRGARCGHLETVQLRRACMRNARATIPQGAQREFNKRTSTRDITAQREVCRAKETPLERLQCLRSQHSNSRSRVTRPLRRARLQQKAPVDFISPQGLRRNLSRARDLVKEKCGDIQDGNEKRACMKEVRAKYQGY